MAAAEELTLLGAGAWLQALWYVAGSNAMGLAAAYLGMVLARVARR